MANQTKIFVLRKKGSKTKKIMKEEETERRLEAANAIAVREVPLSSSPTKSLNQAKVAFLHGSTV